MSAGRRTVKRGIVALAFGLAAASVSMPPLAGTAVAGANVERGVPARGVGRQPDKTEAWLERLTSWLRTVEEHEPGAKDTPALIMGSATEAELDAVRIDFLALLAIQREVNRRQVRGRVIRYRDASFTVAKIEHILGLTGSEAADSNASRILTRGAILHADVAMLVLPDMPWQIGCSAPSVVIVRDGHQIGTGCTGIHWAFGRALLDAVQPDPSKDPLVRLWYQATIAHLLEREDYANAYHQIGRGSLLFPKDPVLLFQHGCFHEAFAAPQVQSAAQTSGADRRPASAHLKESEELFGRALAVNPDFIEARAHHGVVLGALGRHDQAAVELRKAAASAQGPVLRYYVALFLGDEEQAVGRRDAARARYEEAAALFPLAQSPRMALSHLARRYGDRSAALLALRDAFALPADERERPDPWWTYHDWLNQSAEVLLHELYREVIAGGPR